MNLNYECSKCSQTYIQPYIIQTTKSNPDSEPPVRCQPQLMLMEVVNTNNLTQIILISTILDISP